MDALLTLDGLVALVTLSAMEIVLGIDNIVFISILTASCRPGPSARRQVWASGRAVDAAGAAVRHLLGDGPQRAALRCWARRSRAGT